MSLTPYTPDIVDKGGFKAFKTTTHWSVIGFLRGGNRSLIVRRRNTLSSRTIHVSIPSAKRANSSCLVLRSIFRLTW